MMEIKGSGIGHGACAEVAGDVSYWAELSLLHVDGSQIPIE